MNACKYLITTLDGSSVPLQMKTSAINNDSDHHSIYNLSSLICMNPGGAKLTYRAFFNNENKVQLKWQPGDSISLHSPNAESDIDWLLGRMDDAIKPDQVIELKYNPNLKRRPHGPPVDQPITTRVIVRSFLELHAIASRKTTKLMADCAEDEEEKKTLLLISGREGTRLYDGLIKAPSATIMDLLHTFPSCRPNLSAILEIFPALAPRPYSIVDEYSESCSQSINFAFTMVDFTGSHNEPITVDGVTLKRYQRTHGVATGWLKRVFDSKSQISIPLSLHPNLSQFLHPLVTETGINPPLIMVCAGTGIAPFIGFLQFRRRLRLSGHKFSDSWLIFGCRDPRYDFIFAEEVASFLGDETLSSLCLCFSRYSGELPSNVPQIIKERTVIPQNCKYAQHCILRAIEPSKNLEDQMTGLEIGNRVCLKDIQTLVCEQGGHIRVCGDAKGLVPGVEAAFLALFSNWHQSRSCIRGAEGGGEANGIKAAQDYLAEMRKHKRYSEDAWR